MDENYAILISGLIGGSLGVIISKIFDFLHAKQQHKNSLKKEIFIKKITAFEKTIAYWTMVSHTLAQNIMILKPRLREDVHYSIEQMSGVGKNLSDQFSRIADKTQEAFFSVRLYIDISGDYDHSGEHNNFFVLMGEFHKLIVERNLVINELNEVQSEVEELEAKGSLKDVEANIVSKLNLLESTSRKITDFYNSYISQFREEIRRYE